MGELTSKVKGKAKEVAGAATGNRRLEAEGKAEGFLGRLKGAFEELKHAFRKEARATSRPAPRSRRASEH